MSTLNSHEAMGTEPHSALKNAVDTWNAHSPDKLLLTWDAGDWGRVEYDNCQISFHLEQPCPIDAALIRFYLYAESEVALVNRRDSYHHLQAVCQLGVVPMLKPHPSKECIVLEGVSFSIAVAEITGSQIVDIINRVSTAACTIELSHRAWSIKQ